MGGSARRRKGRKKSEGEPRSASEPLITRAPARSAWPCQGSGGCRLSSTVTIWTWTSTDPVHHPVAQLGQAPASQPHLRFTTSLTI